MGERFDALKAHLEEIHHINMAAALLGWDQQTQMPPGGAGARAAQLSTLAKISHEKFTSGDTAKLLDAAESEISGAHYDSLEASLVRVTREDYQQQIKLPTELVAEISSTTALAHEVWAHARTTNDFASFAPTLEKIFDLMRRSADCIGYSEHPYDALLDQYDHGTTTAQVKSIFDAHKPDLVALIAEVGAVGSRVSDAVLHQEFDIEKQKQFGMEVVKAYGYDFNRGRQDLAVHPFCTHFSRNDVRITTRFSPNWLNPALFGTMHEAGHAMYEQNIGEELEGLPIGGGTSLGVHESQSRMWENMVGRSRGFWTWALPRLKEYFPEQLEGVDVETFYRAINRVQPSLIRVEADEATYNLHIMLRFELETEITAGKLKATDLPKVWNERFEAMFGILPPTDTLGVLQDVHWSMGLFGYFATYALGNLLAAQYFAQAVKQHPQIPNEIEQGKFSTLQHWLNTNIHVHGRKFTTDELTRRITGEGIQSRDYLAYLQTKFRDVYGLT